MKRVAGIDGCRRGWVAIIGDSIEAARWMHLEALARISECEVALVAVDMPLGLGDGPRRRCEAEARARLPRARKSSVFPVPARDILEDVSKDAGYRRANERSKARHGLGLPIQTWGLWDKLGEANAFLARADRPPLYEAHPELAFHRCAPDRDLGSKRSVAGQAARRALLRTAGFASLDDWLRERPRGAMAVDDMLDACAVFLTALRLARGEAECVPGEPESNALGQPMRIWF